MKNKRFMETNVLIRIAVLVAIAVVLKVVFSLTLATYRFTFYDIPLIVLGIMFGPIIGGIGGFATDTLNIVYPNLATGYNLFTISTMMWGIIPGLLLWRRKINLINLSITVVITSAVCFGINTLQLHMWMGDAVLHWAQLGPRVVTALIKFPVQVIVLDILYSRVIAPDLKWLKKTIRG